MYKIDKKANNITALSEHSFAEAGFNERTHLQEWLVKNPQIFGEDEEELLIIQKEFSGFDDTKERLDILALDKQGFLVIVENKLDDSGRDVTWQALKYASYCSQFTKPDIENIYQTYLGEAENAKKKLIDFFGEDYEKMSLNSGESTQRIILVSANFRKEVISTVLWLANFGLNIQCFQISLHKQDETLFFDMKQIIPIKEAEEYMIGIAKKNQEEKSQNDIHNLYRAFWNKFLPKVKEVKGFNLFDGKNTAKGHYIGVSSKIKGAYYNFAISQSYSRVELYIDTGNQDRNTKIFEMLNQVKSEIEKIAENEYKWENKDGYRCAIIRLDMEGNINQNERWDEITDKMIDAMIKLGKAISPHYETVNKAIVK